MRSENTTTKPFIHNNKGHVFTRPDLSDFEIVERKFRGHPDSLTDMIAQRFSQLYIENAWKIYPEFNNKYFPNFSADKITLCGASTEYVGSKYTVIKPIQALLLGKITDKIGNTTFDIDNIFIKSIKDIFSKSLNSNLSEDHFVTSIYSVNQAGSDHNKGFYNPKSTDDLLKILSNETVANDTVYVVAYAPLTTTEKLTIALDNKTSGEDFKKLFPQVGTDIKALIRRRASSYDVTMCIPIMPEEVSTNKEYLSILKQVTEYLEEYIESYILQNDGEKKISDLRLWTNTKDTIDKKYFAVWGTALSKGDIGAVGRGNRQQGFISGNRPSTNEAFPGKNPNHFSGVIYQLVAEEIANDIFEQLGLSNVVYITANNGELLNKPNSVDIILDSDNTTYNKQVAKIVNNSLNSIDNLRQNYIQSDIFDRFMAKAQNIQ